MQGLIEEGLPVVAEFLTSSLEREGRFIAALVEVRPIREWRRALDEALELARICPTRSFEVDVSAISHGNIFTHLHHELQIVPVKGDLIILYGFEKTPGITDVDPPVLRTLNLQRDAIAQHFQCTFVLFVGRATRRKMRHAAPDFYDFCSERVVVEWAEERVARQNELEPGNNDAYRKLLDALLREPTIALCGPGLATYVAYPSFRDVVDRLGQEARRMLPSRNPELEVIDRVKDLLWRAEEYRILLGEQKYQQFICDTFSPKPDDVLVDAIHVDLVRLPFKHFLTTGPEAVLERAIKISSGTPPKSTVWCREDDLLALQNLSEQTEREVIYMHGRFDQPASVSFSERDVAERYLKWHRGREVLIDLLSRFRVVLVGVSLAAVELLDVFREAKARHPQMSIRHFALIPVSESLESDNDVVITQRNAPITRRRLRGKYGIEPVFYPFFDDWLGLWDTVRRLQGDGAHAPDLLESPSSG